MRLKGKAAALEVFAIVDAMDAAALAALFTDDATLVFGNAEPFVGPEQIRSGTQGVLRHGFQWRSPITACGCTTGSR
jgi:ketosteroid isomerase-like protein